MTMPSWMHDVRSPLDEKLGLELLEVAPTHAVGRYPVAGNEQPAGRWHGGATCVAAETLASLAASAEVGPHGQVCGVELNASHLRPVTKGWVTGTAVAVRVGGRLATYEVVLSDESDETIAVARVTLALRRATKAE